MKLFSIFLSIFIIFTTITCLHAVSKDTKMKNEIDEINVQVKKYIQDASELYKAQNLMYWDNWVFGKTVNISETYKKYEHLFTKENILLLNKAVQNAKNTVDKRSYLLFRNYLMSEYISKSLATIQDEIDNYGATAKVTLDGKEISYRQLSNLISKEKSYEKRETIFKAGIPVLQKLNELLKIKEEKVQSLVKELGYKSYIQFSEEIKLFNAESVKKVCNDILNNTESLYIQLLKEAASNQQVPFEKLRGCDISYLFHPEKFDKYFTEDKLLDQIKSFLLKIGIDLSKQKNIQIDSEKRETKYSRAVCFTVDVPNDIRMSIKPVGGLDDYRAMFHEMGHSQHYANTTIDSWPAKNLGSYVVTETFAFLFESLFEDGNFLKDKFSIKEENLKSLLHFEAFHKLYFIRRYAAKYLYELDFHAGVKDPDKLYTKYLSKAYGIKLTDIDAQRYRTDMDDFFYTADYLKAWLIEAQLCTTLKKKYTDKWWDNEKSGEMIRDLMKTGNLFNAEEFLKEFGYTTYELTPILERIKNNSK